MKHVDLHFLAYLDVDFVLHVYLGGTSATSVKKALDGMQMECYLNPMICLGERAHGHVIPKPKVER